MSELPPSAEQQLIDDARRAHDPTPEQLARTLDALHTRLHFRGQSAPQRRVAAAAAAALAADAVVASTSKAASAVTGKIVLKLIIAGVALGGSVTTALMVHDRASPAAVVQQAPASARALHAVEPEPVLPAAASAVVEPAPEVAQLAPTPVRTTRSAPRRPSEMTLIGRALASLRDRDPERTLALLDEHAEHHPRGKFVAERKGLRVLALCAAGRLEEGRRARAAFLRDAARTPIAARVREACTEER